VAPRLFLDVFFFFPKLIIIPITVQGFPFFEDLPSFIFFLLVRKTLASCHFSFSLWCFFLTFDSLFKHFQESFPVPVGHQGDPLFPYDLTPPFPPPFHPAGTRVESPFRLSFFVFPPEEPLSSLRTVSLFRLSWLPALTGVCLRFSREPPKTPYALLRIVRELGEVIGTPSSSFPTGVSFRFIALFPYKGHTQGFPIRSERLTLQSHFFLSLFFRDPAFSPMFLFKDDSGFLSTFFVF